MSAAVTLAFNLVAGSVYGACAAPAGASSTAAAPQVTPPTTFSTIYATNDDGEPQGTTITSYPSINTGGGWTDTIGVHPESTVSSDGGALRMPSGVAFNRAGDLWVANSATDTLVEYTPFELAAGGPRRPIRTLHSDALKSPEGIAFDAGGDLWIANFEGRDPVVEFTAHQLALAGTEQPHVILKGLAFDDPAALAFDHAGDLWVANSGSYDGESIVEFTTTSLSIGGKVRPEVTLFSDSSESLAGPWGLAFDAAGDLWVADQIGNHIVEFKPKQLTTGTPVPADEIVSDQLDQPTGIAFDHKGNLWVADRGGPLIEFHPTSTPGTASHIMGARSGLSSHGFLAIAPTTSTPNPTWIQGAPMPPGKPTIVAIGHGSATVSWKPPARGSVGSPITHYFVTSSPDDAECEWVRGPLECTVPLPVNPNWTEQFVVQAQNAYGTSLTSPSSADVSSLAVGPTTPRPTITSLSPSHGSTVGGTRVTITGSHFTSVRSVSFGALTDTPDLTLFGVVNSTTMWAEAPGETPGTVNVAVTTLSGTSDSSPSSAYTYRQERP